MRIFIVTFLEGPSSHHAYTVAAGFDEAAVLAAAREKADDEGMEESTEKAVVVFSQDGTAPYTVHSWWGDDGERMWMEARTALGSIIDALAAIEERPVERVAEVEP